MPLGLEGYCPVTLVDHGTWAEGRVQYGARHRGRTYLFAGVEQQQTFLANPDRYAPALSGDDPVLAMESGVSTPGQRRYGVTYQSRMYLFTSPETRAAFTANPTRYSAGVLVAERGPQVADGTRHY
jgi:protein disulfide-isomerase